MTDTDNKFSLDIYKFSQKLASYYIKQAEKQVSKENLSFKAQAGETNEVEGRDNRHRYQRISKSIEEKKTKNKDKGI